MAWEIIGGILATALGGGGVVGAIISRHKIVREAELTAVEAAERVNTLLVKRVEQLTKDVDDLERDIDEERATCRIRLMAQNERISELERLLHGKQDRPIP